jgi:diacylglycerol kinase (ATP)
MTNGNRLLIIVNSVAARARSAWPSIEAGLRRSKLEFSLCETTAPGDATTRTRDALRAGFSTIAVVGGDGTLSEAAEGFFEFDEEHLESIPLPINRNATLAILPAGTGDDFARGLLGSRVPVESWVDILISHCDGETQQSGRVVDVIYGACDGYTKAFICLNAATMGIGGETAARVAVQGTFMRHFSGEARFAAAAIGALAAWRERRVRVSLDDGDVIECPMNLVAVANGLYAGGGMMLSPQAQIDDGKLDVITASGFTRAAVMRELPRIHRGGHVANTKVRIRQGKIAKVETFKPEDGLLIEADGNVRGRTPAEFRILPRALRFVV